VVKYFLVAFFMLCSSSGIWAQKKTVKAARLYSPPTIDGILEDNVWKFCDTIDDFTQFVPDYNVKPRQRTVVRIGYDDNAIYVAAMMYDSAPDSILSELGSRDDDLNADKFAIQFDTYNMQTDAYTFMVYASGAQLDYRETDVSYNAVWQSAVKISNKGWACEMKINYSALRFPKVKEQTWGMQVFRGIRRHRESDQWSLEVKGQANILVNWGQLLGIKEVDPSLRLSLSPFISLYGDHYPYNETGKSNLSSSFSGGLDLKYGINESFTLDITLLPDFSQVQSDYQVKNISALETVYEEYRPFFNEAIDLFKEGDLFYTRRIGRTPVLYDSVKDYLIAGEAIRKNPAQAKLINAIKFSGRNKKGMAIGVFNAITNNVYATIEDSAGNTRKILTEPLTNYNILVFDQILKNNSKFYIVNTNVIRDKKYDDANVTLAGLTLNDKDNVYRLSISSAMSLKFNEKEISSAEPENTLGYSYYLFLGKVSGNFLFNAYRSEMNHTWDANDMGLTLQNNRTTTGIQLAYNIYEPFWKLRDMNNRMNVYYTENYLAKRVEEFQIELTNSFTTNKYLTVWESFSLSPLLTHNFIETRVPGRYFVMDRWYYATVGFSSDYRKLLALDMEVEYWQEINGDGYYYGINTTPIFRLSKSFLFILGNKYNESINDVGYADIDATNNIIFGKRDITTVENQVQARYMFKNNLSLSLIGRHYWQKGRYSEYYKLNQDGELITDPLLVPDTVNNFNYNTFNIDLMFYWEFLPGSSLSITYKNNIGTDNNLVKPSYFRNFGDIFGEKQLNSLSIKVLYYLDYQNVKKALRKRK
jgi:hypothetical protein